jgi:hypothetical protein
MDVARMASLSDPEKNFQFKRWRGPPLKRISPRTTGIVRGPEFKGNSSDNDNSRSAHLLQWAFRLDRVADAELAVGRFDVAERLAHHAQELREGAV